MKNKKIVKYNATYDAVFKAAFKQHTSCASLINSILGTNYLSTDITFKDIEPSKLTVEGKGILFDINLVTKNSLITLEMQKFKPKYDMTNRLLYYIFYNYANTFYKNQDYIGLPVILICFTDYNFNKHNFIETYTMNNGLNDEFSGIKMVFFGLYNADKL